MILGFTGTREGMSGAQLSQFRLKFVRLNPTSFVHGGAPGADEEAHNEAIKFISAKDITIYPASTDRALYWNAKYPTPTIKPAAPPLLRNKFIVKVIDYLIACPLTKTEVIRSGTWATIRYARQANKPVLIITPKGDTIEESAGLPTLFTRT